MAIPAPHRLRLKDFFGGERAVCNKSPSVEDLRGRPQRQTHDLPDTKNDRAFCDNRAAAAKNLYNVFRAGFIGRPEKANLCTDSTGCAGRTGGGIAIGTSYCSF